MKLKLSQSEFTALFKLFNELVMPMHPHTLREKLITGLLVQIHNKIWSKGIKPKGYSLTLTDPEAIAFLAFWSTYQLPQTMPFEENLLMRINQIIHQKYS